MRLLERIEEAVSPSPATRVEDVDELHCLLEEAAAHIGSMEELIADLKGNSDD